MQSCPTSPRCTKPPLMVRALLSLWRSAAAVFTGRGGDGTLSPKTHTVTSRFTRQPAENICRTGQKHRHVCLKSFWMQGAPLSRYSEKCRTNRLRGNIRQSHKMSILGWNAALKLIFSASILIISLLCVIPASLLPFLPPLNCFFVSALWSILDLFRKKMAHK